MAGSQFSGLNKNQKGAAGIIFIALTPFLFLIFAFSVSVSQRLTTHVKMVEATEVASLALAAEPKGSDYASTVINRYLIDNQGAVTASVVKEVCDLKSGCVKAKGESSSFTDITVQASSKHNSWLTYEGVDLKAEFYVGGKSKARKYAMRPVDLYIITDLSDSMAGNRNIWGFRIPGPKRLDWVKDGIKDVFKGLKARDGSGQSRVSLQGFNHYHAKDSDTVIREGSSFLIRGDTYKRKYVYDYYRGSPYATVRDMFKSPRVETKMRIPNDGFFIDIFTMIFNDGVANSYPYFDIQLTNKIDNAVNRVGHLNANGGSASWNGIIAAAQVANNASQLNPEQVFVILSDGYDNDRTRLKSMVDQGLCTKFSSELKKKKSNLATNTNVHMIAIGLNYKINPNDGLGACVGASNIYQANTRGDIYKQVMGLIDQESGRLRN